MTETLDRCPVHGRDEPGWEWPCPVAYEDSPPGAENCPYFADEIARRIEDMTEGGNFFRHDKDDDGVWWAQEYRDHQPYGDPTRRDRTRDLP